MILLGPAFQEEVLRAHNECRKKHNTSQVTWSNDLAGKAQKWANQIAKKGKFQHAPSKQRKGEGENIACAKGKLSMVTVQHIKTTFCKIMRMVETD